LYHQSKMQLKKITFTKECLISSACILICVSTATSGNSLEDRTFLHEQLEDFPISSHHNPISASPIFTRLENVNQENEKPFYLGRPFRLDHIMSHYEPTSSTAQHHNSISSELMDISRPLKNQEEQFNRKLGDMKQYLSFDVSDKQILPDTNGVVLLEPGQKIQEPLFEYVASDFKQDPTLSRHDSWPLELRLMSNRAAFNPTIKKRGAMSYYRGRKGKRYRTREVSHARLNPVSFWKNFMWQNGAKRNKSEGMTISVTHNLDILRRRLMREIELRERERTRKELMMKTKGILGNIGK